MPPSRPRKMRAPTHAGDDLTQISGIGPVTARTLDGAGIRTYEDLARSSPEELATILAGVAGTSAGRIVASDWCGQARRLVPDVPGPHSLPERSLSRSLSFGLEFLLEADDAVRQTTMHDNQTGADATWPGWNVDRLIGYLRASVPTPRSPRLAVRTRATRGPSFASRISRVRARDPATARRQPTNRPPWGCN